MRSPADTFAELRTHVLQGEGHIRATGSDPVYYLIFRPKHMLDVKALVPKWSARLKLDGFEPDTFSIAEAIRAILSNHEFRDDWLVGEELDPLNFEEINKTLEDALVSSGELLAKLEEKLASMPERGLLFVTDLEALHPYLRFGALEQKLQGKFRIPTVVLYPGRRGNTANSLSFLGIYPEDGNYRSIHIGD